MTSTDEDARQAMASDGGMLKESRIKLFLSSRTEMQKIIEQVTTPLPFPKKNENKRKNVPC